MMAGDGLTGTWPVDAVFHPLAARALSDPFHTYGDSFLAAAEAAQALPKRVCGSDGVLTPPTPHRGVPNTPETELSDREQAFVAEYLADFNAPRAAEVVGYTGTAIKVTAFKVLARPHVQAEIQRQMEARAARLGITADRCLRDIDNAANLDIGQLFDADGNLLPVRLMAAHVRRAIVSIEIVKRNLVAGDRLSEYVHKVKLIDKGKMHEILAKSTGLFSDAPDDHKDKVPAFALPPETPGVSVH